MFLNGANFKPISNLDGTTIQVESLQLGGGQMFRVPVDGVETESGWLARFGSPNQIKLRFGWDIPPDAYQINVSNREDGQVLTSEYEPYVVSGWDYHLELLDFSCLDESNEASPSDEIQTFAAVSADDQCFVKTTAEYEGVDQGGSYSYSLSDRAILAPDGHAVGVDKLLTFTVRLYEVDSVAASQGSRSSNPSESSSKIASALAQSGNDYAVAAGAVLEIVGLVLDEVKAGDGSDPLGEQRRSWTAQELLRNTLSNDRHFEDTMTFRNADSEGSETVRFEIRRSF